MSPRSKKNPASRARGIRVKTPSVWTDERVMLAVKHHRAGAWLNEAAALVGGTYDGLRDALERSPQLRLEMDRAHAQRASELRRQIEEDGDKDKGLRWLLERWSRDTYAPPTTKAETKNEHTGQGGQPLTVNLTIERARELARGGAKREQQEPTPTTTGTAGGATDAAGS